MQFRGQTGAFLEPAPGEPSLNLLKMAREGLLYGLRDGAAGGAQDQDRRPQARAARAAQRPVDATSISSHPARSRPNVLHFLVLFDEAGAHVKPDARAPAPAPAAPRGGGGNAVAAASRASRTSSPAAASISSRSSRTSRRPTRSCSRPTRRSSPQRGAAEHQRGARHRQGRAAVHQRRAEHRQRGAARPQRGAQPGQQRPGQPAGQRADRDRDGRQRSAHPPLHADGRAGAEPDSRRHRPADQPHQAEHRLPRPRAADHRGDRHRHAASARCGTCRAILTRCASGRTRTSRTGSTAPCWLSSKDAWGGGRRGGCVGRQSRREARDRSSPA